MSSAVRVVVSGLELSAVLAVELLSLAVELLSLAEELLSLALLSEPELLLLEQPVNAAVTTARAAIVAKNFFMMFSFLLSFLVPEPLV